MNKPATRAEAREAVEGIDVEGELIVSSAEFLPLNVRRVMYVVAIVGLVVAPFFQKEAADLSLAIQTGASLLGSVALSAALANPTR